MEPGEYGVPAIGSMSYMVDFYSGIPTDLSNPTPTAGTYTLDLNNTGAPMTLGYYNTFPSLGEYIATFTDGYVVVSYAGSDIVIEGFFTDSNEMTHHFTYTGPFGEGGGDEGYDVEREMQYRYVSFYDTAPYNYLLNICDQPFDDYGNTMWGAITYSFDIYANGGEPNEANALPPAGTYTASSSYTDMTFCVSDGYSRVIESDRSSYDFTDGTLTISYDEENMYVEAIVTDIDGRTHHMTYTGAIGATGGDEPGSPVDIQAVTASGSYMEDDGKNMKILFEFSNRSSNYTPGEDLIITAYLPFDVDGNIPSGEYVVTQTAGAAFTIVSSNSYDSYLEIYETGGYYSDRDVLIESGTMTVSGSAGNYTVSCDFIGKDGTPITCSYTGPIEIPNIPGPYSCLTDDLVMDLSDAIVSANYFYSSYYGGSIENWAITIQPGDGNGDGAYIDLYCNLGSFEAGIPSGTYKASENASNEGGYMPGSISSYGYQVGSQYFLWTNNSYTIDKAAPATSGDLIITNNGDGTYRIQFEFLDDKGHTWSGDWSGTIDTRDQSY